MFEEVSGVAGALMGRSPDSGNVGAARYETEARNAAVSISDMLRTFDHFRLMRDRKLGMI